MRETDHSDRPGLSLVWGAGRSGAAGGPAIAVNDRFNKYLSGILQCR